MSRVCRDCHNYKVFGQKCWFFWEGKKACSQYKRSPEDEPHYFSVELVEE